MKKNIAVILAGGVGQRVGAKKPKQFIEVYGKPILAYTIEQFELHPEIDDILVVCVEHYIDEVWNIKEKYHFRKIKWVTVGGDSFQQSVLNGVRFLEKLIDEDDIVLVHFAASPFVTADIISDCIRVCDIKGNAISTTDYYLLSGKKKTTVSVSDPENCSLQYIDRETIAVMNSPHAFKFGYLKDLYNEAIESGVIDTVEPHTTTLMYALGRTIYFAKGSQNNIKITRKEDLDLFEGYVLNRLVNSKILNRGDVIVLLADGFEECEAMIIVDMLKRAGVSTIIVSINQSRIVRGNNGLEIVANCLIDEVNHESAKLLFLPGGQNGIRNLTQSEAVKKLCCIFAGSKMVATLFTESTILNSLGILQEKKDTSHTDYENELKENVSIHQTVAVDDNIIVGQGICDSFRVAFEILSRFVDGSKIRELRSQWALSETVIPSEDIPI